MDKKEIKKLIADKHTKGVNVAQMVKSYFNLQPPKINVVTAQNEQGKDITPELQNYVNDPENNTIQLAEAIFNGTG